jgi:chitin synthase
LIVLVGMHTSVVPLMAFVLLGAIYGLQAIIFILRRKWEMIGWMIIYILAMPVFSMGLPLYAFWHMDDFTWGNTRLVTGEAGKQILISDEGKFNPDSIPKKKWEEYQAELWDAQTQRDETKSEMSGYSYGTKSYRAAGSVYGGSDTQHLIPVSRSVSQLDIQPGMYGAAPPYNQSRMSLAPSEMLGIPGSRSVADMEMADLTGMPTDDMILNEIRDILRTADLMTVTKKGVKQELERRFNCSLDMKRAYIGSGKSCIDSCGRGDANERDSHRSRPVWPAMIQYKSERHLSSCTPTLRRNGPPGSRPGDGMGVLGSIQDRGLVVTTILSNGRYSRII